MHARADVHARDGLGGGALTGVLATANKDGPTQRDRDGHRMGETGFANLDEGKLREIKGNQGNSCIAATFFLSFNHRFRQNFGDKLFSILIFQLPLMNSDCIKIANVPIGKIGIQKPTSSVGIDKHSYYGWDPILGLLHQQEGLVGESWCNKTTTRRRSNCFVKRR